MRATRSELVGNRVDLAHMLNAMGLTHEAVEVGTDRGLFAQDFLGLWKGEMLYCVDHWESYPEMFWDRSGDFLFAVHALAGLGRRCRLVKTCSMEAARRLAQPQKFEFIYIDGEHTFDAVTADLENWLPRLTHPGVLAGHDYDVPGVRNAVDAFAAHHGLMLEMTSDHYSPSWFAALP